MKKFTSAQAYLKEMFGEQFLNISYEIQNPMDKDRKTAFKRNLAKL